MSAVSSSAPDGAPPPPELEPSTHDPPQPSPPSASPHKKTAPLPWSHMETVHLIEAYQEKWYSLKRGQLKASQWEEVSISVAVRCGYDEPSKTATQCRHKMEKLRKRYRSEKQRSSPSLWPFFNHMDRMERGPFPIAARPISSSVDHLHHNRDDDSEDDDEDDDDDTNKSRSINHILRRPPMASRYPPAQWSVGGGGGIGVGGPPGVSRFLRNPMFRKRKSFETDEVEEQGVDPISELASVVRAFGEGFVRIENMKMEMMKETERYRMEMETKRTEMILESQSRIIEAIAKSLGSQKSKKPQEI
ncbi:trihelix transcription factor ASIL2-like [Telopea speciosissima]|uniref:trihelix transcription factor ASIL2-like n=1 Tax=Telopea speciosissima TaxID=54955 RepID=UPI001CC4003B|nr:trihelix transcription factor ASIL2-like [Telopea speciosissima]